MKKIKMKVIFLGILLVLFVGIIFILVFVFVGIED